MIEGLHKGVDKNTDKRHITDCSHQAWANGRARLNPFKWLVYRLFCNPWLLKLLKTGLRVIKCKELGLLLPRAQVHIRIAV